MSTERLALVTGGARGIGYACAEALKEDGYDVILCDIDADGVAEAAERLGAVAGIACDMADAGAVLAMFDRIEAEHGRVSALVNNAGVAMPGDFLDYDLAAFDAVIAINLRGTFVATQRAAKTMVANGIKGAIVNMSSINAQLAIPAIPAYCASKGGVMQLTKVAALALAPKGIRVNAVGPGSIDTDMMAGVNANAEALKRVLSRTPLGRVGSAARDRGRGRLPVLGEGQLHHRRDDLCRWRAAGAELHDVRGLRPPACGLTPGVFRQDEGAGQFAFARSEALPPEAVVSTQRWRSVTQWGARSADMISGRMGPSRPASATRSARAGRLTAPVGDAGDPRQVRDVSGASVPSTPSAAVRPGAMASAGQPDARAWSACVSAASRPGPRHRIGPRGTVP
jgi:glucose 1-dehydrogenase